MKNQSDRILIVGIFTALFIILIAFNHSSVAQQEIKIILIKGTKKLKKEALSILVTKCNSCHKKQNPFMIFKEKNMSKRAPKIYQMVFVERIMPKGNEVKLSNEEYKKLKQWLFSEDVL